MAGMLLRCALIDEYITEHGALANLFMENKVLKRVKYCIVVHLFYTLNPTTLNSF